MKNLLILLGVAVIMIVGFMQFGFLSTVIIAASGAGAYYLLKNYKGKAPAAMGGMGGYGGWY